MLILLFLILLLTLLSIISYNSISFRPLIELDNVVIIEVDTALLDTARLAINQSNEDEDAELYDSETECHVSKPTFKLVLFFTPL